MPSATDEGVLFPDHPGAPEGVVVINARCSLRWSDGFGVVSIAGVPHAHFVAGDRAGSAYAMVLLVDSGWAQQREVARAFRCDVRTVRRHQRRFALGGLAALGRPPGFPRGRSRLAKSRLDTVNGWKAHGISNREIARRLGISEKAVRKLVKRLGWQEKQGEQLTIAFAAAGSNLSGPTDPAAEDAATAARPSVAVESGGSPRMADPNVSGSEPCPAEDPAVSAVEGRGTRGSGSGPLADSNMTVSDDREPLVVSLDSNPTDRAVDRLLARLGLLDDAPPVFGTASEISGVGALLAIPALVQSGVLAVAREIYGSLGPAFYGLRTTLVTLLLMALLRVKRPEGLKERSPRQFGQLLGLDRAPEVKTLRRKLAQLASAGLAAELGRALARRRVTARGHALGFLYVDGHVRAYHGSREIPKTPVARMRIAMSATTDYWVNDAQGEPLFVVPTEANQGLVKMLPVLLEEVRKLLGERRFTVVFDRGGWSPQLFAKLIAQGCDILTYRKAPFDPVPESDFVRFQETVGGHPVTYDLADQSIEIEYGRKTPRQRLSLRQVTRLGDGGHQTHILTSRRDLSAIEVACRMFDRWRQENFFKYLREELALDALVDYGTEPADGDRSVPNPERAKIDAELRKARADLEQLQAHFGLAAFENHEQVRRTMRGFKIANAELGARIRAAMRRITELEKQRTTIPTRIPVREVVVADVVKLSVERKHLTDLLKMVAYQAETELLHLVSADYRRSEQEGRTLVQSALSACGDLQVTGTELIVSIDPLSSPHKTQILAAICEQLNKTKTRFPGTHLMLRYTTKPEPAPSLAFPGARSPSSSTQPDI